MKNLITLFALFFFTIGSYAQTATVKANQDDFKKALSTGYVEFVFPEEITSEDVNKSAQYYTEYFTVTFNQESHVAKIKLNKSDDPLARKIIQRFLLSSGIRTVHFNEKDYSISEFYNDSLK